MPALRLLSQTSRNEHEFESSLKPACFKFHACVGQLELPTVQTRKEKRMKTLKCPVCDWEIKDGGKAVKTKDSAEVVVCCDDCAQKLKAEPGKYLSRAAAR